MKAFIYGIFLKWKMDLRDKGILLTYYVVPLIFYLFMSGIFSSVTPTYKDYLIQAMSIFGVTLGSLIGASSQLIELYSIEIKKSYKVGHIPLYIGAVNNYISAFIHLFIMTLIMFVTAPLIYQAKVPENLLVYFVSLALFILTSLGVGTVLGLLVKNNNKLTMISQLFFLPSLMLSGIMFPVSMLPSIFETVGKAFPASWGFLLMTNTSLDIKLIIPLLIILVTCFIISSIRLSKIVVE